MITNKISIEMSLQGSLPFYEYPHTCRIDGTTNNVVGSYM